MFIFMVIYFSQFRAKQVSLEEKLQCYQIKCSLLSHKNMNAGSGSGGFICIGPHRELQWQILTKRLPSIV